MPTKRSEYFDQFVMLVDYSCQSSQFLHECLEQFEPSKLPEQMNRIHEIEHNADTAKHAMMKKLAKEFLPPIEREDIIQLAQEIDEVTDRIEDVLMRLYMYNRKTVRDEALIFSSALVRCCTSLKTAMQEFHNFHKSATLNQCLIEVNTIEEEGDRLYLKAIRNLYENEKDPVEIMAWTATFDCLERCCDACEHVANVVEGVIMKNS